MSRPASSTSSHRAPPRSVSSTVPFTPRPKHQPRDGRINDQDLDEIAQTLASVRKVDRKTIRQELDAGEADGDRSYHLEESTYRTRPLTSRVASNHNTRPQRITSSSSTASDRLSAARSAAAPRPSTASGYRRPASPTSTRVNPTHSDKGRERYRSTHVEPRKPVELEEEVTVRREDLVHTDAPVAQERKLEGVPVIVQESWICEDLRFVLQGVSGELIQYADDYDPEDETQRLRGTRWKIDPSMDPSLRYLVEKILPLATFFTAVNAFVDLRNDVAFGMVNHALASGIRGVLREYHVLTAKLESLYLTSPEFTLQSAFQYLHPTLHILSLLYALCLALDHDPFPEFDETTEGGEDEEEGNEEADRMKIMAAELGLDLARMGLNGKKERDEEAAKGTIIGGEALGVIIERATATCGDPVADSLYSSILLHASQPYARILVSWITTGTLKDPYDEFMIREDSRIDRARLVNDYSDEYWERRYTLRDGSSLATVGRAYNDASLQAFEPACRPGTKRLPGGACVPPFLEAWKFKILLAGKYLNVIKECDIDITDWKDQDQVVAELDQGGLVRMDQPRFYQRIETAYVHSNKTLLNLILREKELLPNLRSMKHFFFLDQSEFLNQFFDNAHTELKKPSSSASMTKIQSLLYMAVGNPASASSSDPHKEQLRAVMTSQPLYSWLLKVVSKKAGDGIIAAMGASAEEKGADGKKKEKEMLTIEALALDFDVKFPLSLVISRKAVTRYQLIFRFLLGLRYLEFSLTNMWTEHKTPKWRKSTGAPDLERWKRRIYVLRAQMLQWIQHMLGFVTGDVLETNWKKLEDKLAKVSTIDQLLRDHVEYLDTCLKECTLTSDKLITVTSKIVTTITTFTAHQSYFVQSLNKYLANPRGESTEDKIKARWEFLEKFENHFKHHVVTHLDTVTYLASSETPVLLALVARLTPLRDKESY